MFIELSWMETRKKTIFKRRVFSFNELACNGEGNYDRLLCWLRASFRKPQKQTDLQSHNEWITFTSLQFSLWLVLTFVSFRYREYRDFSSYWYPIRHCNLCVDMALYKLPRKSLSMKLIYSRLSRHSDSSDEVKVITPAKIPIFRNWIASTLRIRN